MKLAISVCALRVGVTIVEAGSCAVLACACYSIGDVTIIASETAISVRAHRVVGVTIVKAGSCAFVLVCHVISMPT